MERRIRYGSQHRGPGGSVIIGSNACAGMPGAELVLARHLAVGVSADGKDVMVQALGGNLPGGEEQKTYLFTAQGTPQWEQLRAGGTRPVSQFPARLALGSKDGPQVLLTEVEAATGLVEVTVQPFKKEGEDK